MKSISKSRKEAASAAIFVLKVRGQEIYVADEQESMLIGCTITDDINKALMFSVGFDNPDMKKAAWTYASKMKLEIVYL
jgi:hypothetical protein